MQGISLVDGLCKVSLGSVVQFLDLIDLVRVEDVLIADFLEEPDVIEKRPLEYLGCC